MDSAPDGRVGESPGVNIRDGLGGATAPGSKSLVSVGNISGSRGISYRYSEQPRRLLEK